MKTLNLVLTAMNAALYTVVGYLTSFGVLIFGVRFWPAVIVPATFAALFGPWVGGVGAALGIILSDMIYGHGNALLSVFVGVPSNLGGFAIIGILAKIPQNPGRSWMLKYLIAGFIGLAFGTTFIGFGLIGYFQLFTMIPGFEVFENPTIQLGIITAVTNFIAEIPFVYLAIPIIKPVSMAFPGLFRNRKSE